MKYRHIFFDLDHTLWDFDRNAEEALRELYSSYSLEKIGVACPSAFIETYTRNNHALWADYHLGKITKDYLRETRFSKTFADLGIPAASIPSEFEDAYVKLCPTKTNLFPKTHETLCYLSERYTLHLISNGFMEATQMKIRLTGLKKYFSTVVISEVVGVNKPDKAIFEFALDGAGAKKEESLMIGDSLEADIMGALKFGMDAIYFNPAGTEKPVQVTVQIAELQELIDLL